MAMGLFRDASVKQKLTLIIMGACTIALLLLSIGFVAYESVAFRRAMARDVESLGQMVGNQCTAALTYDDPAAAEEILRALAARKGVVAAALYRGDRLFTSYSATTSAALPPRPAREGISLESNYMVHTRSIELAGERIGTLYLKSDLTELHARLREYAMMTAILALGSWLLTYLLSKRLQAIVFRPIHYLAQTARAVSRGRNYALRVAKLGNDELGQFTEVFNEMLAQIQERDAALQQANDRLERRVYERTRELKEQIGERERAQTDLREQLKRIHLLNRITQVIAERQDLESILHVVLRQLQDHLNVDLGTVALYRQDNDGIAISAIRLRNNLLASKLDLPEGCVVQLAEAGLHRCLRGESVYVADTLKEHNVLAQRFAQAGLRSAAAVPLMFESKLFGVLIVARLKIEGFAPGECEFLGMLSEHVALAAHQAQLHRELKVAYENLRESQQTVMQQERLKALGQMASGIAHDINNALSPVVGFADLLERSEAALSPNGKRYLDHIKTSSRDVAHIVERLRDFYRRRDEREALQPLPVEKLVHQVLELTRPRWRDIPQGRGIMIEVETGFDPAVQEIVGVESEVREALTNLIINAVDAMASGGKITVRTRKLEDQLPDADEPGCAMIEVIDTGVGMDETTRRRCLEPFFSTKGQRGTGLGLAMVYGVMERHDGEIRIQSEFGKGTTIQLLFPLRSHPGSAAAQASKPPRTAGLQILCIDDEPLLRELLKEILEHEGHRVELTDGGQAGIEAFRTASRNGQPFDVVITDLGMPYVDGRQVVKVLRRESPGTPIVLLTGWGAFMKENDEFPAQVDGVLSKPPRWKELREMLARVASKHPATLASN